MKIVIASHGCFPTTIGGIERHTYNLAKYLKNAGEEVHVLLPKSHEGKVEYPFSTHFFPWEERSIWLKENYDFSKKLGEWIDDFKPDVALSQGFNLWGYLKKKKIPVVFHPHGLEMYGENLTLLEWFKSLPFRYAVRNNAKFADRVISLGGRLTSILNKKIEVPMNRLVEIPNAIDLNMFQNIKTKKVERKLLFVGRLAFNKGIDLFSKTLQLCKKNSFTLTMVGDGPMRNLVEELARKDSRVIPKFSITEDELINEYSTSEALLFTSRFEGMPTVILEAMAAQCSVIATDIGAVGTMVRPETGMLIRPNASEIAYAIQNFLQKPFEDRLRMGLLGRSKVEQEFSWDVIIKKYLHLFHSLIQK